MLKYPIQILFWVSAFFIFTSCNRVQFNAKDNNGAAAPAGAPPAGGPVGGGSLPIACSPILSNGQTSTTITTGDANPGVIANCNPSSVTYSWTVTKSGSPVTINGLTGASSVADFQAAGVGTYLINLDATASGYTTYHSSSPLTVVVQVVTPPVVPNVVCGPRVNGGTAPFTLSTANPTITANCNPSNVSYVWTTTLNGTTVSIAGLSGSSSTPNFLALNPGTYLVYLTASVSGYNTFTATNPLSITVPQPITGRDVNENFTVSVSNNKLDVVLVVDDSYSMVNDATRLAGKLQGFVNNLQTLNYDWQMCLTTTHALSLVVGGPTYWGASVAWSGIGGSTPWILKMGTASLNSIFTSTVSNLGYGFPMSDDERAIKALHWHLYNGEPGVAGTSGCYRSGAGLAVIIISDEDERSIGGDATQIANPNETVLALESDDLPQGYVDYVHQLLGAQQRLTVNSIIVRPGDQACKSAQDHEPDPFNGLMYPSHYGVNYAQLSQLTSGYSGSICDSDYSANLQYYQQQVVRSQNSFPLQCNPLSNAVTELLSPSGFQVTYSVDQTRLISSPAIPAGYTLNLQYRCAQ